MHMQEGLREPRLHKLFSAAAPLSQGQARTRKEPCTYTSATNDDKKIIKDSNQGLQRLYPSRVIPSCPHVHIEQRISRATHTCNRISRAVHTCASTSRQPSVRAAHQQGSLTASTASSHHLPTQAQGLLASQERAHICTSARAAPTYAHGSTVAVHNHSYPLARIVHTTTGTHTSIDVYSYVYTHIEIDSYIHINHCSLLAHA